MLIMRDDFFRGHAAPLAKYNHKVTKTTKGLLF